MEYLFVTNTIIPQITVYLGQLFTISVEARAYIARNFTTLYGAGLTPTDVTATITKNTSQVSLGHLQETQPIQKGCSNIAYQLFSLETQLVQIVLTPRNERVFAPAIINVDIQPCPLGFAISRSFQQCECDEILKNYGITCNSATLTVNRPGQYWIGILNISNVSYVAIGQCEFYCNETQTDFKLTDPNAQCIDNRSGPLCGRCQDGYSIAIGSSKCLKCSNAYLALLIVFAAAGILLIFFLLLFRVTVSSGRINSFLFFANVIKLGNSEFFDLSDKGFALFQVIISWFNLDFGIQSCFYDGLDSYSRAWLQFAFSFYIYILLAIPVISARYSTKIAKILPRNTLPVMTTTFLITFTKLLRASTVIFPYTPLHYSDGIYPVWTYDGNVAVFSAKYIPLFLFSLFVMFFVVIPFALLMFFYPFIWSFSAHEGNQI